MIRYFITGGAGFIGGHLTELLLSRGHQVTAFDNLSTGSMANLSSVEKHPAFRFVHGDVVEEPEVLNRLVREHDVIIHLAAAVGVELVVHDPVRTITTNVHGTENVLRPAADYDKRLIVASTSEVYGKSSKERFNESDDLLIGCPTRSRWSYACSKLLDEFYVMAFHRACKLRGTVVRFFNTVGPRQTGQYGMVVPRFVQAALENRPLSVYGNGEQSRCFCHVFDTIEAVSRLVDASDSFGGIYNIGSTSRTTILELAQKVISQLNSDSTVEFIPYEKAYEKGFEDMMHRAPDIEAVARLTNWRPMRGLSEIINDVATHQKMLMEQK